MKFKKIVCMKVKGKSEILQTFIHKIQIRLEREEFVEKRYRIAGRCFQVNYHSSNLCNLMNRAIMHLQLPQKNMQVDMMLYCVNLELLEPFYWKAFWQRDQFINGFSKEWDDERYRMYCPTTLDRYYLFDHTQNIGYALYRNESVVPWWEQTFPFRIILHFWSRDNSFFLIHSGAIVKSNGFGALISGPSGSGKSTTCLTLMDAGYLYLGDDYIWIEKAEQWKVFSLYLTVKIVKNNFENNFDKYFDYVRNEKLAEGEKYVFDISQIYPERVAKEAMIETIIIPNTRLAASQETFHDINLSKVVLSIAATTLHHLPHDRALTYRKIVELVQSVKCVGWNLNPDYTLNVKNFENL